MLRVSFCLKRLSNIPFTFETLEINTKTVRKNRGKVSRIYTFNLQITLK